MPVCFLKYHQIYQEFKTWKKKSRNTFWSADIESYLLMHLHNSWKHRTALGLKSYDILKVLDENFFLLCMKDAAWQWWNCVMKWKLMENIR